MSQFPFIVRLVCVPVAVVIALTSVPALGLVGLPVAAAFTALAAWALDSLEIARDARPQPH